MNVVLYVSVCTKKFSVKVKLIFIFFLVRLGLSNAHLAVFIRDLYARVVFTRNVVAQ